MRGTAKIVEEMKREVGVDIDAAPRPAAREQQEGNSPPPSSLSTPSSSGPLTSGASDIHLEPQAEEMVVRMRVDGLLHQMLTVPADLKNMVVSRLKIMGSMDIAERRVPQDGHTTVQVPGPCDRPAYFHNSHGVWRKAGAAPFGQVLPESLQNRPRL